ncbi:MAG TPA: MEDS domain-containing protein [Nitrososphaeraceae archaeon]|nr:MEDS domain-containing protein [Nitrososphaeraceae archaeon]
MNLDQLNQTKPGAHYIAIYDHLITFRQIYSFYTKIQLEENNELVLLLPHYETTDTVRRSLRENEYASMDVRKYEKQGLLVIIDSVRAYFCSTSIITFVERLVKHAQKLGKNGVTAIADMGSFFQFNYHENKNKKTNIIEYETSLPSKFHSKLKGFCCYNQKDFDRLTERQKKKLVDYHGKVITINK